MTFPLTWTLQADVSGTALGGSPTWTDVTSYVLPESSPLQVTDGRRSEQGDVNPGQMQFALNNNDNRWTPGNSSSPYYPHIKPAVRFRLTGHVNSTDIDYYDGLADGFTPHVASDRAFGLCDVSCTDVLGRFGNSQPLKAILEEEINRAAPVIHAPFTDPNSATVAIFEAAVFGGSGSLGTSGWTSPSGTSYAFGATGPQGDMSGAVTVTGTSASNGAMWGVTWSSSYPGLGTTFNLLVFYTGSVVVSGRPITVTLTSGEVLAVDISGKSGSQVVKAVCGSAVGSGATIISPGPNGLAGMFSLQAVTSGGSTTVTTAVYQGNSNLVLSASDSVTHTLTSTSIAGITMAGQIVSGAQSHFYPGTYSHLCVFSDTAVSVPDLASAGLAACAGETVRQRVNRYLGYRPGATLYGGTTGGTEYAGVHEIAGLSLQQALFDCAHVEQSPLYVSGDGQIVLMAQSDVTAPSVKVTVDVSQGGVTPDLQSEASNQYLLNEYEITPSSGNVQIYQDVVSQQAYGYYSNTLQAPFNSDSAAYNAAQRAVLAQKDPALGFGTVSLDLFALAYTNPLLCQQVLQVTTGQVAQLTNLRSPFPSSLSLIVLGRTLTVTRTSAVLAWTTAPEAFGITWAPTGWRL